MAPTHDFSAAGGGGTPSSRSSAPSRANSQGHIRAHRRPICGRRGCEQGHSERRRVRVRVCVRGARRFAQQWLRKLGGAHGARHGSNAPGSAPKRRLSGGQAALEQRRNIPPQRHPKRRAVSCEVVVMPQKRVRRTKVISEPSPHVPLAFMNVEHLPEPEAVSESGAPSQYSRITCSGRHPPHTSVGQLSRALQRRCPGFFPITERGCQHQSPQIAASLESAGPRLRSQALTHLWRGFVELGLSPLGS